MTVHIPRALVRIGVLYFPLTILFYQGLVMTKPQNWMTFGGMLLYALLGFLVAAGMFWTPPSWKEDEGK